MKGPREQHLTISLSRQRALQLDLLICGTCGHRENNHFDHGANPCAHCGCQEYREDSVTGTILKEYHR